MIDGDESRRNDPLGLTHVHHFYSRRNLLTLSDFAALMGPQRKYVNLTSVAMVATKMYRFRSQGGSLGAGGGPLSGTLYVPSLCKEIPVLKMLEEHIRKTAQVRVLLGSVRNNAVQTGSSTMLSNCPSDSVDYLFLDPPFGGNLMYADLNYIWESWLKVITAQELEAVTSKTQEKGLDDYQKLMLGCFQEFYRILKPGRWITVEFSNTQSSVWNALQATMQEAGFVIASVAALDKQQRSFKAVTTPTAVKQDLVISAYKPNGGLEVRFAKKGETEEGVWDFIRTHLGNLPVVKPKGGQLEPIAERDPRILYDRTVAFYIKHGIPVPISSPEFQAGLADKFPERDGMYFLPDQAAEYDKARMKVEGLGQLSIFVTDERSSADWLRNYLKAKPSKYQDIQPEFFEKLNQAWKKWETRPELRALLD
jgi:16S rRNA G966 N2-methylase RsmD